MIKMMIHLTHLKFINDILGKVTKPFIWSFDDLFLYINLLKYTSNKKSQDFI